MSYIFLYLIAHYAEAKCDFKKWDMLNVYLNIYIFAFVKEVNINKLKCKITRTPHCCSYDSVTD